MSHQLYFDTMYEEFQQRLGGDRISNDLQLSIPQIYGHGFYNMYSHDDFILTHEKGHFFEHTYVDGHTELPFFFIVVIMKGGHGFQINRRRRVYEFKKGRVYFGFAQSEDTVRTQMHGLRQNDLFSFTFSPYELIAYLKEFDNAELLHHVEHTKEFKIFHDIAITPRHRLIIETLTHNPFKGSLKKMYRDSYTKQLLLTLLEDLSQKRSIASVFDEEDQKRLHRAKEILLKDLQDPPTIHELSHMVALNEDKLKKGFKSLFETTIFKTLTQERMLQALSHVKQGDMSVSQIAFEAGYENVSSFIATFKKTYGKTPGVIMQEGHRMRSRQRVS